jgi:hypothetical protein
VPRLTFNDYLKQRAFLRLAREEFDQLYSLLSPDQQWALHRYYQPLGDDTDDALWEYRAHVTKREPSLPARAGKLYAKLHGVYEAGISTAASGERRSKPTRPAEARVHSGATSISVRALARPEPDLKLLARAFLAVAVEKERRAADRRAA